MDTILDRLEWRTSTNVAHSFEIQIYSISVCCHVLYVVGAKMCRLKSTYQKLRLAYGIEFTAHSLWAPFFALRIQMSRKNSRPRIDSVLMQFLLCHAGQRAIFAGFKLSSDATLIFFFGKRDIRAELSECAPYSGNKIRMQYGWDHALLTPFPLVFSPISFRRELFIQCASTTCALCGR